MEVGEYMERTRKPTAAGILCIIAGCLILVIPVAILVAAGVYSPLPVHTPDPGDDPLVAFLIVIAFCVPAILLGTVAVVGGIYALRRQIWALALAGAICALPAGLVLGIPAIIFIVRGKAEFKAHALAGDISPKSRRANALLALFLGALGVHRFYIGRTRTAAVMFLLTITGWGESIFHLTNQGFFVAVWFIMAAGIWAFIDFIAAVTGNMTDKEGRLIQKW